MIGLKEGFRLWSEKNWEIMVTTLNYTAGNSAKKIRENLLEIHWKAETSSNSLLKTMFFVFFLLPRRDFQTNTAPGVPGHFSRKLLMKKFHLSVARRSRWFGKHQRWHVGPRDSIGKSGNPTKKLRRFLKLDRFSFLKAEIETIHYNYKNPTIQQVLNSNKNNQWSDGGFELVWLDDKQTLQAKKTIQNIVRFRVRIFQKKNNFFKKVTSPTNLHETVGFCGFQTVSTLLGRFLCPFAHQKFALALDVPWPRD